MLMNGKEKFCRFIKNFWILVPCRWIGRISNLTDIKHWIDHNFLIFWQEVHHHDVVFQHGSQRLTLVLVIGGSSPMNESDLLMTSLPPVLLLIGFIYNSCPLNFIICDWITLTRACVYNLASGGNSSDNLGMSHVAPPAERTVPKSVSSYRI